MLRNPLPNRNNLTPDTPLRLSVPAAVAFPDGSMTASGLVREAARGRPCRLAFLHSVGTGERGGPMCCALDETLSADDHDSSQ